MNTHATTPNYTWKKPKRKKFHNYTDTTIWLSTILHIPIREKHPYSALIKRKFKSKNQLCHEYAKVYHLHVSNNDLSQTCELWRTQKIWQTWIQFNIHINICDLPEWIEVVDIFKWHIIVSQLRNGLLHRPPTKSINKNMHQLVSSCIHKRLIHKLLCILYYDHVFWFLCNWSASKTERYILGHYLATVTR